MRLIGMLVLGGAIGWFVRDLTFDKPEPRAERSGTRRTAYETDLPPRGDGSQAADRKQRESDLPANPPPADGTTNEPATTDDATEGAKEAPAEDDAIAKWVKSASPQWKAWATMQTKQKVRGLFDGLGLDKQTQEAVAEALMAEAERQAERAMLMMLGELEIDTDAFDYFMGLPPELSNEVLRELGTFLDDDEINAVRQKTKEAYEEQATDMADMQINMMGVKDLSDDQNIRLREVFKGRDIWKEQMTGWAEVTRDREVLKKLVQGDGKELRTMMKTSFEGLRRRVADILTPEQFKGYESYEKSVIMQAEMGVKMMGAMLKSAPSRETKTPAGK